RGAGPGPGAWAGPRAAVAEDPRAVGQRPEGGAMRPWRAAVESLGVQPRVDRVRALLARIQRLPERDEAVVVLAAALGARAVAGRERRRLIEEEELGVASGLHEPLPAAA